MLSMWQLAALLLLLSPLLLQVETIRPTEDVEAEDHIASPVLPPGHSSMPRVWHGRGIQGFALGQPAASPAPPLSEGSGQIADAAATPPPEPVPDHMNCETCFTDEDDRSEIRGIFTNYTLTNANFSIMTADDTLFTSIQQVIDLVVQDFFSGYGVDEMEEANHNRLIAGSSAGSVLEVFLWAPMTGELASIFTTISRHASELGDTIASTLQEEVKGFDRAITGENLTITLAAGPTHVVIKNEAERGVEKEEEEDLDDNRLFWGCLLACFIAAILVWTVWAVHRLMAPSPEETACDAASATDSQPVAGPADQHAAEASASDAPPS